MNIKNIQQRVREYRYIETIGVHFSYTKFYAFMYLLQGVMYKSIRSKPYIERVDNLIGIIKRYK